MEFLKAILPQSGYVCVATAKTIKDRSGKVKLGSLTHIPFENAQTLVDGINDLKSTCISKEVYFCPASLSTLRNPNDGFRKSDNVHKLRSLYLDVDIRDKPAFCHSYEDAIADLARFCEKAEFPQPWVVDSGNGLHIYWQLEREVNVAEWERLALGLLDLVKSISPRLVADATKTRDKVALLRLPGFINHKHSPSKEVTILCEATEPLALHKIPSKDVEQYEARLYSIKPEDKADIRQVIDICKWYRAYLGNKEFASEPEWYAALGLARYLYVNDRHDPYEAAIFISEGYPTFSHSETIKKVDQLEKNGIGPTTCQRFAEIAPERCRGCPIRGLVASPIVAAKKIANSEEADVQAIFNSTSEEDSEGPLIFGGYEVPQPPKPFFFKNNQIFATKPDSIAKVFDFLVVPVNRCKDEYTGQELVEVLARFPHDGDRYLKLPMSLLADDKRLGTYLADFGILPERKSAPLFYRYLVDYIRELQLNRAATRQYVQLGWRFPDPNDATYGEFVLGDYVYTKQGWVANTSISPALAPVKNAASSAGSLSAWKEAFGVLNRVSNAEPLIATALMAFAAPLIEFTPYNGLLVNLYGESGRGKSTAQRFASSVWGVPNERMILTHDNRIPMLNRLGAMHNLPVTFDELTEMDSESLGTLLYEITGGRGKERALVTGITKHNETTWKTIVLSSSNVSIYSKIAKLRSGNNAQAYRVLELEVLPASPECAVIIDNAKSILDRNYGMAGRVYSEFLAKNLVAVKRLVEETIKEYTSAHQKAPAERFWIAAVAAMHVGASIAKDIGLHSYNVDRIATWLIATLKKVRFSVAETLGDPINLVNQFLLENINNTLRDDGSGSIIMVPPNTRGIAVRYFGTKTSINHVAITKKALIDYCKYYKVEYGWLLSALKERDLIKGVKKLDILRNTGLPPVEVECLILDSAVLSSSTIPAIKNINVVESSTLIN